MHCKLQSKSDIFRLLACNDRVQIILITSEILYFLKYVLAENFPPAETVDYHV